MSVEYLHTMLRISDIDESLRFFCEGLGLKELRRVENEAGRFTLVFLAAPEDATRYEAERDQNTTTTGLPSGLPMIELTHNLSLIHISSPRDRTRSRMPSSA